MKDNNKHRNVKFLFGVLLILSPVAQAQIVNVDISASWTAADFTVTDINDPSYNPADPNFDGAVFGVAPSNGSTTVHLQVDTTSAVAYSQGYTFMAGGNSYTLTHDWYGYSNVQLLGTTHTFGSASWDSSGIVTGLVGVDDLTAALWTDADIISATPTLASFRMFGNGDGLSADLFVGSRSYETITNSFLLWEYFDGEEIRLNGYSITTNPVPVPAALWLFGSGLLGLVAISRKK